MHEHGKGVEHSTSKALGYYIQGVKRNDLDCMILSGQLLASGKLGEVRHDLALPAFGSAAELGSAFAQNRLGMYYEEGNVVDPDLKRAHDLFEAAAVQGYEPAAYNLARMYERGNTALSKNLDKAIQWYEVAAEKGIAVAQHNLAACYARRHASNKDWEDAALWFHRAAEQGLKMPMESLAQIYARGEGVERDLRRAEYWASRAAATVDDTSII